MKGFARYEWGLRWQLLGDVAGYYLLVHVGISIWLAVILMLLLSWISERPAIE
jgi:hypothetical protein